MENFSFKQMTVEGATKEEALAKTPFTAPESCQHDATAAYRILQKKSGVVSPDDLKQWMFDFMKKKKMAPGQLAYVTLQSAVKETRKRPYEYRDVKHEGARRPAKVFQIFDRDTKQILATTTATEVPMKDRDGNVLKDRDGNVRMKISSQTKADAKKIATALYTEHGYMGNLAARVIKKDLKGDDIVFEMDYAKGKNTKNGKYIVFGLINND